MRIPVLFNCLGDVKGEQTIAQLLVRQVCESVYMEDTIRRLSQLGVDTVVEIGPGRALSGFVAKTVGSAITCHPVEDVQTLEAAIARLRRDRRRARPPHPSQNIVRPCAASGII